MKTNYITAILLIISISSCDIAPANKGEESNLIKDEKGRIIEGVFKRYYPSGKLQSKINYKDGKRHGYAVKYFEDGKTISNEYNYEYGKLNGIQKKYYKSGKLYRIQNLKMGVLDGEVKKYRESGKLMSVAVYKDGFAGTDLKEYLVNGKPKKKYPKIMIETVDNLTVDGSYKIKIYMSDHNKKVKFYLGHLKEGRFLHKDLKQQIADPKGVLTYTYFLMPGDFVMKELNIVAKTITRLNNVYVTTRKYQVGIEYPLY